MEIRIKNSFKDGNLGTERHLRGRGLSDNRDDQFSEETAELGRRDLELTRNKIGGHYSLEKATLLVW